MLKDAHATGHTDYQQLPTICPQLLTNTIYRQQTRNSEAPTEYRQVLFADKYRGEELWQLSA